MAIYDIRGNELISGTGGGADGITPEQYGAVGDGAHDDAAALQAATDAAAAQGKALILGCGKIYRIKTVWNIPGGSRIDGSDAVILTDETDAMGWQGSAIRIAGADDDNWTRNVVIRNFTVRAADTCPTHYMLQMLRCSDVIIESVTFDCDINDLSRCCLDMYGAYDNITFRKCVFKQLSAHKEGGLWVREWRSGGVCRNIRFIGCDIYKAGGDEVFAVWGWRGTIKDVLISECNFYEVDEPKYTERGYYPAWFITLGQSGVGTEVRMENCNVRVKRCASVFRMINAGTRAVVENCDIVIEQPADFPHVQGANPLLGQGNSDASKTIIRNCRIRAKGDEYRTLCYKMGALIGNVLDIDIGVGAASCKNVAGNTITGSVVKGLFWDCESVLDNQVDMRMGGTAWMSGAGTVRGNRMNFIVEGDAQGSGIFHNNWGSGTIIDNEIEMTFESYCDLRAYDFPVRTSGAQHIQNNIITIDGARYSRLENILSGVVYRKNNYYNHIPEKLFECTGVSFAQDEITKQYKKYDEVEVTISPKNCTDPVIYTWTNDDGAILDRGFGNYRPLKDGSATVTVHCGMFEASQKINVALVPAPCESAHLSRMSMMCGKGMKAYLKAFITPYWTTDTAVWSSDAENIATVTQDGEITGIETGSANITLTCGTQTETCVLTVVEPSQLPQYTDGEWVLDGSVAYIPLPNLTAEHSVYCNFEIAPASLGDNDNVSIISGGLSKQTGEAPVRIVFSKIKGYPSINWYTTDVEANSEGKTQLYETRGANNAFTEDWASSNFLYLKDGIANPGGAVVWRSSASEATAAPNSGYLSINVQAADEDEPVTGYRTNAALKLALEGGHVHASKATGLKIKELIVFANGLFSTRDEFIKYRESAEIDIRFDADGNVMNAGTSGPIVWSNGAGSGEVVEVESVTLNKAALTLEVGASETLTAAVLPTDSTERMVVWSVSPEGFATVKNGTVKAVAAGECTVTATCGGKSATCAVTVQAASSGEITVDTAASSSVNRVWNINTPLCKSLYVPLTMKKSFKLKQLDFTIKLTGATSIEISFYNKTKARNEGANVNLQGTAGDYRAVADCDIDVSAGDEYQIWINSTDTVMCYPSVTDNSLGDNEYFDTTGSEYRWNNDKIRYLGYVVLIP